MNCELCIRVRAAELALSPRICSEQRHGFVERHQHVAWIEVPVDDSFLMGVVALRGTKNRSRNSSKPGSNGESFASQYSVTLY